MAITKPPKIARPSSEAERFIANAPDAAHDEPETARVRKQVISLGVDPRLLKRFDAVAARLGITRAAAINLAMTRLVDGEGKGG